MNNVERWRVKVEGTILRGLKDGATTHNIAECIVESILEEAISAVKNDMECKGKWISVDERLPDKEGTYLTYTDKDNVDLDIFCIYPSHGTKFWSGEIRGKVTHWMPLPEAPKGGAE
jgi:hypothetical protein